MSRKSELKENVLATKVETALRWMMGRRVQILIGTGIVIAALLIASVFIIRRNERRDINWTRLSQAQDLLAQKQFAQSRQILTEVHAQTNDLHTQLYTTFYLGQLNLAETQLDLAIENFSAVIERGERTPLAPLALSSLGHTWEQKGDFSTAAQTYQKFMDQHEDHFMAPRIQLALGRSLARANEIDSAKEQLGQLIDLYPTSSWAENARRILDKLESR